MRCSAVGHRPQPRREAHRYVCLGSGSSRGRGRELERTRDISLKQGSAKDSVGVKSAGGGWLGEHARTGRQPRPTIGIVYGSFLDETEELVEES